MRNGLAGLAFGEPLTPCPRMRLLTSQPGGPTRTSACKGTTGWDIKHRARVRTQPCCFPEGKVCRFPAPDDPAVRRPQGTSPFGPGPAQGQYQLYREGNRARTVDVEKARGFGWEDRLHLLSQFCKAGRAAPTSCARRRTPGKHGVLSENRK